MYNTTFFHFEKNGANYFLANELGNYITLDEVDFHRFRNKELTEKDNVYQPLKDGGFLYENDIETYIENNAFKLEQMKSCMFSATQLFIFVLTNVCNQRCIYCQAGESHTSLMPLTICKKAVDLAVQSPVSGVTIEFQGGEPTLNPDAIRYTVKYAKELFYKKGKNVCFSIVTNFTNYDPDLFRFLIEENVSISTSLDGPSILHDINRPLSNNKESSYEKWKEGFNSYLNLCAELKKEASIGALQTTTKYSLTYFREIVDEYLANGINTLYIRPLTPLGKARTMWDTIGYTAEAYLEFYYNIISYMISVCKQGNYIKEATAAYYLERILKKTAIGHTEYRSPCGAATGQMAINFDGQVYTCDEGRMMANMGDNIFCLGTVNSSYKELIQSPTAHAVCTASCIEALPFCSTCVYSPFCAVCPVVTYGLEGDLITYKEDSYRCQISKGILKYLFEILNSGNQEDIDVLYSWIF